jgi:hypothetical protein
MMIHAVSMIAVLADQVAQTPVAVQCAPSTPDPWWKWLLQTIVPVAGGTLIAVWSFVKNRKSEHGQWVRDQERAEWKELMSSIANVEHHIPIIITGIPDHKNLESVVLGILPLLRGMIFVYPRLETSGFIAKWQSYAVYISGEFLSTTHTNRSVLAGTLGVPVSLDSIETWDNLSRDVEVEARVRLHALLGELRDLAHRSLEMKDRRP